MRTSSKLVGIAASLLLACGGDKKPPTTVETVVDSGPPEPAVVDAGPVEAEAPKPKTLFERLGGKDGISAVVDAFLANVLADKRINKFFEKTAKDKDKTAKLRQNVIDQICEATGGDCKYTGKDMKTVHKDMKISDVEWNAFVEDLTKAMKDKNVGETEQSELLGKLGGMHDDIVTVKKK
jgi:hemoglobin